MEISKQATMTDDGELEQSTDARFRALYQEQELSVEELADRFGCSTREIYRHLRECGILPRIERLDGEAPPARFNLKDGYEMWSHGPHHVRVHRLLMIAEKGFAAVAQKDDVHHETEVKWDNRPDELRLFTKPEHGRRHGRPEVTEDQQTLDSYPTQDETQEQSLRPERRDRQMTLTAFEETESAAAND
jgi:AraC-like DNA-binding protein